MILDLHNHSIKSDDGRAKVENYCKWIAKRGLDLDGFVLSEHRQYDSASDYRALEDEYGILILKASEVETEYGHVLLFGVNEDLEHAFDFADVRNPPDRVLRETTNGADTHPDCVRALDQAIALCESLGHRVEVTTLSLDKQAVARATQSIISGNLLSVLEDRADDVGREFGKDDVENFTYIMTEAVRKHGASDYARAIRTIHAVGREIEGVMQRFDLLLSPTMAAPPMKLGVLSLSNPDLAELITALSQTVGYTQIFNASGHPAISLPLHWNDAGLPIGIQFIAGHGNEGLLFQLASQIEQAQPWNDRRAPPVDR